jgi:hypothetical protein
LLVDCWSSLADWWLDQLCGPAVAGLAAALASNSEIMILRMTVTFPKRDMFLRSST